MIEPISHLDILIRLGSIVAISGLIGLEREYYAKPAGLRTNVMVGLGSTLMTLAGIRAVELFPGSSVDPTRIAAQVITGIGFIGAGAILRPGNTSNVVGLTTAATLWVVSGLGISVGLGFYYEAMVCTLLVFFTFFGLGRIVHYVRHHSKIYPSDIKAHEEVDEKPHKWDDDSASAFGRFISYIRNHSKTQPNGQRPPDDAEDPSGRES